MSTRALYTFIGNGGNHNVYKHHDGYPSGAARTLKMAIDWFAWQLPRYESDEFAAAFVTAGKFGSWLETQKDLTDWWKERGPKSRNRSWTGGGVRLMPQGTPDQVAKENCSDIEYRYEIRMATSLPNHIENTAKGKDPEPTLWIKAFSGSWWDEVRIEIIFEGPFDDFYKWALKAEEEAA